MSEFKSNEKNGNGYELQKNSQGVSQIKKEIGFRLKLLEQRSAVEIAGENYNILQQDQEHKNEQDVRAWLIEMVAIGEHKEKKETDSNSQGSAEILEFGVATANGEVVEKAVSYGIEQAVSGDENERIEKEIIEKTKVAEEIINESAVAGELILAITRLMASHDNVIYEIDSNKKIESVSESARCFAVTETALKQLEKDVNAGNRTDILSSDNDKLGTEFRLMVGDKEIKITFLIAKPEQEHETEGKEVDDLNNSPVE